MNEHSTRVDNGKQKISIDICETYSVRVNDFMMTTLTNFEVVTSNLPITTLGNGAFHTGSNNLSNKEMPIGNTSS